MAVRVIAYAVAGVCVIVQALRTRGVVNGLQVLIAKGRKHKRRGALQGNYAPIKTEIFKQECQVVSGELPAELDGMYMRNGSNPYYEPYASFHWFEGDGMVHATRIKDSHASYCNHFVRTHKLQEEQRAGFPIYAKFGDQEGLRGVFVAMLELLKQKTGILKGVPVPECGNGTANTSLVYHAGRLLALHEGDLPYQVRLPVHLNCDVARMCSLITQIAATAAPPPAHLVVHRQRIAIDIWYHKAISPTCSLRL
eukprot:GHRR01015673.1.p1 GENE.GHRR01015673.1~~GHRR01015673.1.p1  ORF type:complete len:253 (+),score=75.61 GHRR01015673.1:215-973(+)